MLPEEWLKKYGVLAGMGKETGDHLRFTRARRWACSMRCWRHSPRRRLTAYLKRRARCCGALMACRRLKRPSHSRASFGLTRRMGWDGLSFCANSASAAAWRMTWGSGKPCRCWGCCWRRDEIKANPRPSLVVVPRSLVFNWMEEAKRFAPGLKVLDHSHSQRTKGGDHLADYDVVLTTYGTLRNDAVYLKDIEFDYLILDESQAIKNAASESAKAARLMQGRHRLALSGTPVQNHLGDLWSLFEFLNPGMLGTSSVLSGATALTKSLDQDTKLVLAKSAAAVHPATNERTGGERSARQARADNLLRTR